MKALTMHAHFDCFSGISGDMVLGAFIDLGISRQWLATQIGKIGIDPVDITATDIKRSGIGGKQITIVESTASPARNFKAILNLIENAGFRDPVETMAINIFTRIAQAESHVHRCKVDDVHFHEVGAVDSIVDIVGAALCVDYFSIESISASPLPLGSGVVDCAHGRLPVPAPAVLEILKGVPVYGGESSGEMVTPTGAGIITSLTQEFGPIPDMTIERTGYGGGTREIENMPNLLRVLLGHRNESETSCTKEDVCVVETNIDDMNPELFGYVMEKLLMDGALDVCFSPVTMKKNRPGTKVEILCNPEKRDEVTKCLLTETSTIGVRYHFVHRQTLKRRIYTVTTCFGDVQVKGITDPTGRVRHTPEYDACTKIARDNKIPLQLVYETVANTICEDTQGRDVHDSHKTDGPSYG